MRSGANSSTAGGKLVYSSLTSLDGYVADRDGAFDWAQPDEEVHAFINDLTRPVGTFLLGRRMYEVLRAWDTIGTPDEPAVIRDFAAIWLDADKVVFSSTLDVASTARTRIERTFDPDVVRRLKADSGRDLAVGGPNLGSQAIRAGLVDEIQLFLVPAVVGGGTRFLPEGVRLDLELQEERRFGNGTVFVRYRVLA